MAKNGHLCFSWPAHFKNSQKFEIGNEMAKMATLLLTTDMKDSLLVSVVNSSMRLQM